MFLQWILYQENVCTSSEEVACVNKLKVDSSSCLKPCSGLIVTSFYKSKLENNLETLFPIFGEYNQYKKVTSYPSAANGMSDYVTILLLRGKTNMVWVPVK